MSSSPPCPLLSCPSSSTSSSASPGGGAQDLEDMFRRRLRALGHFDPEGFNSNDKKKFRHLVAWLEDQLVRRLTPDAREGLREVDSDGWDSAWEGYLDDLECDRNVYQGRKAQLMWLLGKAVQLHYTENVEEIKAAKEGKAKEVSNSANGSPDSGSLNPFEGVNIQSAEFRQSVSQLSSKLRVAEHPTDPLVTLHACCLYLSKEKARREEEQGGDGRRKGKKESVQKVNLEEHDMNIPESLRTEQGLCQALKILRLLHIQDLRCLQDEVNATIESVQKLTADPKTDTRLGKVGR